MAPKPVEPKADDEVEPKGLALVFEFPNPVEPNADPGAAWLLPNPLDPNPDPFDVAPKAEVDEVVGLFDVFDPKPELPNAPLLAFELELNGFDCAPNAPEALVLPNAEEPNGLLWLFTAPKAPFPPWLENRAMLASKLSGINGLGVPTLGSALFC